VITPRGVRNDAIMVMSLPDRAHPARS